MNSIPQFLNVSFVIITIITIAQFYNASNRAKLPLLLIISWAILQLVIGLNGFYLYEMGVPPRFVLLILPPVVTIILTLTTTKGKLFVATLSAQKLTLLHTIRIPVELVLYGLACYKYIPTIMTFEGYNFDIVAGISAIVIYYYGYVKQKLSTRTLIVWNVACILLLLNIVIIAVLAAPTQFQLLGFEQPNIAIAYFPYVWLPSVVVPLVLFSHLVSIKQLLQK
ncbi:MAG: hypothetical protein ABL940_09910 [Bacteroidia bacterium]